MTTMQLTPDGEPPGRGSRWCPRCQAWIEYAFGRRRCASCGTALIRPMRPRTPKPGELRPGVIAEFDDPRDAA
jgi:hypothetical protein